MSWLIRQYPDGKYGLYTTISDGWIVKKAKREYVIEVIKQIWHEDLERKIAELEKEFPNMWFDKDTHKIIYITKDESKINDK